MHKKFNREMFSLIELLIVISIIAILASILFPALQKSKMKMEASYCANNMKQIGLAMFQYSNDFNEWLLPAVVPNKTFWSGIASDRPWIELLGNFGLYSPCDYGIRICSLGNSYHDVTNFQHGSGVFIMCPSQKTSEKFTFSDYAVNKWFCGSLKTGGYCTPHKMTQITSPSIAKYVLDNGYTSDHSVSYVFRSSDNYVYVAFRHLQRTNILYVDGHITPAVFIELTSLGSGSGATELQQGF